MTAEKPRQYTVEEQREMFLDHIRFLIDYCEKESRRVTSKEKLELLAFGFLTMLDGVSGDMPAFDLIPRTHSSDPEYHRELGENWWPTNRHLDDVENYEPINGDVHLHDLLFGKTER